MLQSAETFFWDYLLPLLKIAGLSAFLLAVLLVIVAFLLLFDRKVWAAVQLRKGPNVVGPFGLFQSFADLIKFVLKEPLIPAGADKGVFLLAPLATAMFALAAWAVIPVNEGWMGKWVMSDLNVGMLYVLAISSLGVYGITIAGWSSNNKYALLGSVRSTAQMVSYEIAMGMATIPVLLLAGNVSLSRIVNQQAFETWNVINLTVAFFIFLVAAFAETNRLPFDLPEAEAELVTGYHTEYSAMKFSLFFIAEYCNMITASALMATLFFGGWDIPFTLWDNLAPHTGIKTLLTLGAFATKTMCFLFLFMWIRWTLPRFRYDQLMSLGWKFMLPLALGYIVAIASLIVTLLSLGFAQGSWPFHLGLAMLNVVSVIVLFMILDRGRIISPASSRLDQRDIARLRAVSARPRTPLLPETGD